MPLFVCEDMFRLRELADAQRSKAHLLNDVQRVRLFEVAGHVGEFVQAGEQAGVRPFAQENAALEADQEDGHVLDRPFGFGGAVGELGFAAFGVCPAESCQRALFAQRCRIRQADGRAEVHEGLVVGAGSVGCGFRCAGVCGEPDARCEVGICVLSGLRCQDAVFVAGEPREDAQQVAVDGRGGLAECDGADGGRRVGADPRQFEQIGRAGGHLPAIVLHEDHGGLVEIADTAVVAKSLPQFQIGIFIGSGE